MNRPSWPHWPRRFPTTRFSTSDLRCRCATWTPSCPPAPLRWGANGIDGLISSGLGASANGRPVVILSGDLSLLHDLTALGTAARFELPVTVIVLNNNGGGIFHFLPQADFPDHFERLLGTPHGTDFQAAADLFGIEHHQVEDDAVFKELVRTSTKRPRLIEVRTDRTANVAVHEKAWRAATAS